MRLDRVELLLLLSSALSSLGCVDTVRALRRETGVTSEQRAVERVRAAILAGHWQHATSRCDKLLLHAEGPASGGHRRVLLGRRVAALLHAGLFLDQLHAAIDTQQPPVEALLTLTQRIATLELQQRTNQQEEEEEEESSMASFVDLCGRWLPSSFTPSALPRASSLLCVLSSLLLCTSVSELSRRSGCDASSRSWRALLADRLIECLPRASAVPHNQLVNMLAVAACASTPQQLQLGQQQLQLTPPTQLPSHYHSSHPQPAVPDGSAVDVSLLAAPPQRMSERSGGSQALCTAYFISETPASPHAPLCALMCSCWCVVTQRCERSLRVAAGGSHGRGAVRVLVQLAAHDRLRQ